MNENLTEVVFVSFVLLLFAAAVRQRKQRIYHDSQPVDNMTQQKRHLIARIQSMKYMPEKDYYQWEIHDFCNRFLFHEDIGAAKDELKTELQMKVNELSIPSLMNV
jgi:hypothetical protein